MRAQHIPQQHRRDGEHNIGFGGPHALGERAGQPGDTIDRGGQHDYGCEDHHAFVQPCIALARGKADGEQHREQRAHAQLHQQDILPARKVRQQLAAC